MVSYLRDNILRIKKVRIKNFRGYGENPDSDDKYYEFDNLNKNMVLFSGHNGFGKTSFFDAIEWCLMDDINRLKRLVEVYGVTGLKDKHYLKFFSKGDSLNKRNEREIDVELTFDDGTVIKRTSRCDTLKLSNSHNYSSSLFINSSEIKEDENSNSCEKAMSRLLLGNDNFVLLSNLLKSNFLGQETINEFLRKDDPKTRKSTLMKLLSYDDIEEIYKKATKLKHSRKLSSLKKEYRDKIENYKNNKKSISDKFTNLNMTTVENYIIQMNNNLKYLLDIIKNDDFIKNIPTQIDKISHFDFSNIKNNIEIIEGQRRLLESLVSSIDQNMKLLVSESFKVNKVVLLEEYLTTIKSYSELEFIKSYPLNEKTEALKKVSTNISEIKTKLEKINNLKNSQSLYKGLVLNNLLNQIDIKENLIKGEFWILYGEITKIFNGLFVEFSEYKEVVTKNKDEFDNVIRDMNINNIKITYNDLNQERLILNNDIKSKTETRDLLTTVNTEYCNVLDMLKNYIIKNNNVTECPVCLNNNFSDNKYSKIFGDNNEFSSTSDKLIKIIEHSISNEDKRVNEIELTISAIQKKYSEINSRIKTEFIDTFIRKVNLFNDMYKSFVDDISIELESTSKIANDDLKKYIEESSKISNQIKAYEDIMKKYAENNSIIKNETIIEKMNEVQKEKIALESKIINELHFIVLPTMEEIIREISSIKDEKFNLYYEKGINNLKKESEYEIVKKDKLESLIKFINEKIIAFKLNDDDYITLNEYNNLDFNILNAENAISIIEDQEDLINKILDDSSLIYKNITEKVLKNHNIINWIYDSINPHPNYRSAHLNIKNDGILVTDESGEICLDHIYSSAQMNVLALSIFLGIGLNEQFSNLGQLFLDDPIQSMDDIKIYSFIDLLRAILDSSSKCKNLVISTHDDNFAKLVSIKMRNKDIVHYNFQGYFEEGPIYKKI